MQSPTIVISSAFKNLLLVAALMTALLVSLGGVVCVTESGLGCPDWPTCYGRIYPPARIDAVIEYSHRIVAVLSSALILAASFVGLRRYHTVRWLSWPLGLSIPLLVLVSFLGARTVLHGLTPFAAAVDLGSALLVLALVVVAAAVAIARQRSPSLPDRLSFRTPLARLALICALAVLLVLVSGVLIAEAPSKVRCLIWPLTLSETVLSASILWRSIAAGIVSILFGAFILQVWRTPAIRLELSGVVTAAGLSLLVNLLTGVLATGHNNPTTILVLGVISTVVLWVLLVAAVVLAALPLANTSEADSDLEELI